jgi:hypothetical protein
MNPVFLSKITIDLKTNASHPGINKFYPRLKRFHQEMKPVYPVINVIYPELFSISLGAKASRPEVNYF